MRNLCLIYRWGVDLKITRQSELYVYSLGEIFNRVLFNWRMAIEKVSQSISPKVVIKSVLTYLWHILEIIFICKRRKKNPVIYIQIPRYRIAFFYFPIKAKELSENCIKVGALSLFSKHGNYKKIAIKAHLMIIQDIVHQWEN